MIKHSDTEIQTALDLLGKFVQITCQDRKHNPSAIIIGVSFCLDGAIQYFISFTDYGKTARSNFCREEFEIIDGRTGQ